MLRGVRGSAVYVEDDLLDLNWRQFDARIPLEYLHVPGSLTRMLAPFQQDNEERFGYEIAKSGLWIKLTVRRACEVWDMVTDAITESGELDLRAFLEGIARQKAQKQLAESRRANGS